jgi:tripartite-type tricarboxylate transporter receptor subunit TctC
MKTLGSRFVRLAAALAACAALAATAEAQSYPTKPIKVVVPFAPGGIGDLTARVVAQKMTEAIKQQVLIDNRPSAGSIVASQEVAKAEPDGYTLLFMTNSNAVSATLFKSLPYDTVKDFIPISTTGFFDPILVVNAESKYKTLADLVAAAKANPGKLNLGTIAIGSTQHLSAELFKSVANIDVQIVPHKATPQVIAALRSNDIDAAFEFGGSTIAQIKSGVVRALAIASPQRFAALPDVPTSKEAGLPNWLASSWNGMAAPAKTPQPIIDRLAKEITAAVALPDVKKRLLDMGVEARSMTPQAFRELLISDIAKWKGVIERAKIERQ